LLYREKGGNLSFIRNITNRAQNAPLVLVLEFEEISSMLAHMDKEEFFRVTGVEPETFDQLKDGTKVQLLNAVGHAVGQAQNPEDAQRLATEAVLSCCDNWKKSMQNIARFIVPPGESDSVASLEHKLSKLRQKVGLADQPQEV